MRPVIACLLLATLGCAGRGQTPIRDAGEPLSIIPLDSLKPEDRELPGALVYVDGETWGKMTAGAPEDDQEFTHGAAFVAHKLPGGNVILQPAYVQHGQPAVGKFVIDRMSSPSIPAFVRLCVRGIYVDPRLDEPGCRIVLHGRQPPLRCVKVGNRCQRECKIRWKHVRNWGTFYYCVCR